MPNWLDRLLYRIAIETSWHGVNLPSRLIYRYRCPYPIIDEHIGLYTYESGWSRVECDKCWGIFSCESTKLRAVKSHNAKAEGSAP